MQARRLHQTADRRVIIAFNTPNPPNEPPKRGFQYPDYCYNAPQSFSEEYPFMAFCARFPEWSGSIFGCLQGTGDTFPLAEGGLGYSLDVSFQRKWMTLEWTIEKLIEIITHTNSDSTVLPLNASIYRQPRTWGYLAKHSTQKLARRRILNSRNAFVPLLAHLNYAIAADEVRTGFQHLAGEAPAWYYKVRSHGVNEVWFDVFVQHSFVTPFAIRIGTYIDYDSFSATNLLAYYIQYNAPVYVKMPVTGCDSRMPAYLQYTRTDLAVLPCVQVNVETPKTRQRRSDTVDTFFQRQDRQLARVMQSESQAQGVQRLLRAIEATRFICPLPDGAHVFEWIANPRVGGLYIRTYIPREDVPRAWRRYPREHKKNNSVHHEWDLCPVLPDVAPVEDIQHDESVEFETFHDKLTSTESVGQLTQTAMEEIFAHKEPVTEASVPTPRLDDILYQIYGFNWNHTDYPPPSNVLTPQKIASYLGEDSFVLDNKDQQVQAVHFVTFLLRGYDQVPPALYDLKEGNNQPVHAHQIGWAIVRNPSGVLYRLFHSQNLSLNMFVPSASYIAQAHRIANVDSILSLAIHFCRHGSRFYLGDPPEDQNPFNNKDQVPYGLGFRSIGFKPTWLDYAECVKRRNELLSDHGVVRAALMQGGIIWRLTLDALVNMNKSTELANYFMAEDMDAEPTYLTQQDLADLLDSTMS